MWLSNYISWNCSGQNKSWFIHCLLKKIVNKWGIVKMKPQIFSHTDTCILQFSNFNVFNIWMVALSLNLSFYIIEKLRNEINVRKIWWTRIVLIILIHVHPKYLCIILNGLDSKLISGVVFNIFLRAITCVIIKRWLTYNVITCTADVFMTYMYLEFVFSVSRPMCYRLRRSHCIFVYFFTPTT